MKKILPILIITATLTSCVQDYSEEYKIEAQKACRCMELKQANRKSVSEDIAFIYDDEDYKVCVVDAIINEVDTKSAEFTNAIEDACPETSEIQKRYAKSL